MAFDEHLAERVRRLLAPREDVDEKQMFGGIAFMIRGHMACGIVKSNLMVRVDPDAADGFLREPHARPMDFTGRPMRGFLFVDAPGVASAPALRMWVGRAVNCTEQKSAKNKSARKSAPTKKSVAAKSKTKSEK